MTKTVKYQQDGVDIEFNTELTDQELLWYLDSQMITDYTVEDCEPQVLDTTAAELVVELTGPRL